MFIRIIERDEAHYDNQPYLEDTSLLGCSSESISSNQPVSLIHLDFHNSHVTKAGCLEPEVWVKFSGSLNIERGSMLDSKKILAFQ